MGPLRDLLRDHAEGLTLKQRECHIQQQQVEARDKRLKCNDFSRNSKRRLQQSNDGEHHVNQQYRSAFEGPTMVQLSLHSTFFKEICAFFEAVAPFEFRSQVK